MLRMILTTTIMLTALSVADAASYYVRKTGNDARSGTNKNNAFKTIAKATRVAGSGDYIFVGAGTYDESITWDPSKARGRGRGRGSGGWTMIYADRTGSITGDKGEVVVRCPNKKWGLNVRNAHNLLVYGLTFEKSSDVGYGCIARNSTGYVYFIGCTARDLVYGINNSGGQSTFYASGCRFDGCTYAVRVNKTKSADFVGSNFYGSKYGIYTQDLDSTNVNRCNFDSTHPTTGATVPLRAIVSYRTALNVSACTFSSAAYGVFGNNVTMGAVADCTFTEPTTYGIYLKGENLTVDNSTIKGKNVGTGCALNDTSGKTGQLKGLEVSEMRIGIRADATDLSFTNVTVSNCRTGVHSNLNNPYFSLTRNDTLKLLNNRYGLYCTHNGVDDGNLEVDGFDFSSNEYGIYATGLHARISNCVFADSIAGTMFVKCKDVEVRQCQSNGKILDPASATYGIYVQADKTTIRDSKSLNCRYGFTVVNRTDTPPDLKDLVSSNTTACGLYVREGKWNWSASHRLSFTDSRYGVMGRNLDWTVDSISVGTGCDYALLDYYGNLSVSNSNLNAAKYGLYSRGSESITLANCQVTNCGTYGIYVHQSPKTTISGSTFATNKSGARVIAQAGGTVSVSDSQFSGNTAYGLYIQNATLDPATNKNIQFTNNRYALRIDRADLTVTPEMQLSFKDNQYAIMDYYGHLSATDITLSDNDVSLYSYMGSIDANGCTLSGKTYGIFSYLDGTCEITNCKIRDAARGIYVLPMRTLSQPIKITDSLIENASSAGLYARDYRAVPTFEISGCEFNKCRFGIYNVRSHVNATNVTIRDSSARGYYQRSGTGTFTDSTVTGSGQWSVYAGGDSFEMRRSTVAGGYGIALVGKQGTLTNTVVRGTTYGAYLRNPNGQYSLVQNTFGNITLYGIRHDNGNTLLRNSIVQAGRYGLWNRQNKGTLVHDHNLIRGGRQSYRNASPDETEIDKDPIFVNVAAGDLHLAAGSPAINTGADLSASLTTDLEGNARPSFRRFELGAYEYMQASGSIRVLDWDEVAQ